MYAQYGICHSFNIVESSSVFIDISSWTCIFESNIHEYLEMSMKMIKKLVKMVDKKYVMNDKTFFLILLYTWSLLLPHSALTFLFLVQEIKLSSIDWQNKVNQMKIYLSEPYWEKIYIPLSFNVEHRTSWRLPQYVQPRFINSGSVCPIFKYIYIRPYSVYLFIS